VQFLWLANDTLGPFLGQEGVRFLDAWANTGMSPPFEMAFVSTAVTSSPAGVPGEASSVDAPGEMMVVTGFDAVDGTIHIDYTPACDATEHNIYYGDLASVSLYDYAGAACSVGVSGQAGFAPALDDVFFVVVANNGAEEGSYGRSGDGVERPEDVGTAVCDRAQNLDGVTCE